MKFRWHTTHDEARQEAKFGFITALSLIFIGGLLWALAITFFANQVLILVVPALMVISGGYVFVYTAFHLLLDLTIGRAVFFAVFALLIFVGGLMSMYELFTTP